MILRFQHRGIEAFYRTGSKAGIQAEHAVRLRLILGRLNISAVPRDMDLPGLRLHPLKGPMAGRWSVAISANWRVTFVFNEANVDLVDYEDYH